MIEKIILAIAFVCSIFIPASAQKILLTNATIIDGDAKMKPYIGNVLINNGNIELVSNKKITSKGNTIVLDCSGKYITPGIIDAHVHLATVLDNDIVKSKLTTDSILHNMVLSGITTVRDMAGNAPYLAAYKKEIGTGKKMGPEIFYAAQFAGPEYFELIGRGGRDKDLGTTAWYRSIDKNTDIQKAIKDAKDAGVTGIKIYADLTASQIKAITQEAHKQGLMAWAHAAIFPSKPLSVIKAGVNTMSHANDMAFQQLLGDTLEIGKAWGELYKKTFTLNTAVQKEMMRLMAKKKIILDPTVFHASNNNMISAITITEIAHKSGVRIAAGTDWIYPTEGAVPLLDELIALTTKCGLTNAEAIQAATVNAAAACGREDRGRVKKGMRADILILNENPLQNIEALFRPKNIILHGQIVTK